MPTRRDFLAAAAVTASATTLISSRASANEDNRSADALEKFSKNPLPRNEVTDREHYRPEHRFGLGGVAIGTAFERLSAERSHEVMKTAWECGVRYFDTSPWYGLGISERRMAHFLDDKVRDDFVISTKIGRVLTATDDVPDVMWKAPSPFGYEFDYTADGTRRSLEDSLQRMGMSHFDIVFIHDLAPDHMGDEWTDKFDEAAKGAIPTLTKMREEGTIKAWGFGVNNVEPCLRALEEADPDIFLLALQYSIVYHQHALKELLPKCEERGVSVVVGAPFNSGLLAGKERYNYRDEVPDDIRQKAERISEIAREHGTDLRTAALQFCNAPKSVSSVIPGASTGQQVIENALSMVSKIPTDFWAELKAENLIEQEAPTPG